MRYLRLSGFLLILFILFGKAESASSQTDTLKQIPFLETWDSASFTTNHWTFPWGQGNWTILSSEGNPPPCAAFTGTPSQSNYIFAMVSPWFDTVGMACDRFFLDFNLKLTSNAATGSEKLIVLVEMDSAHAIWTFCNDSSFDWRHQRLALHGLNGNHFRIRFHTIGTYSNRITSWMIDSIQISRQCPGPEDIFAWWAFGYCTENQRECGVKLSWPSVECSFASTPTYLVYDDGTWEDGLRPNTGNTMWIGTKFPVSQIMSGVMQSVDLYFVDNGSGSPQNMRVELFDMNQISLGMSDVFNCSAPDAWINVPLPDIPFMGPVYAMVKFENLSGNSYFLACDTDGPYASQSLAYQFDGTTWSNPPWWPGGAVFLVRGYALVENKKGTADVGQAGNAVGIYNLEGYNLYRKEFMFKEDYVKVNQQPITDTFYMDTIICSAHHYVTAVYNTGCESAPLDAIETTHCYWNVHEAEMNIRVEVVPSSSGYQIKLSSGFCLTDIEIFALTGSSIGKWEAGRQKEIILNLPDLAGGIYILSVETPGTRIVKKLMINNIPSRH